MNWDHIKSEGEIRRYIKSKYLVHRKKKKQSPIKIIKPIKKPVMTNSS